MANYKEDVSDLQQLERRYRENAQAGRVDVSSMPEDVARNTISEMLTGLGDVAKSISIMIPDFSPHREFESVDATKFGDGSAWITFSRGDQERGFHIYTPNAARELKMSFTSRNKITNQAVSLFWTVNGDLYSCTSGDGVPSLYGRHMMKQ